MKLLDALRNFALIAGAERAEKKVDGFEIGKKLDMEGDAKLGDKTANKLGRGPLTNFIFEIIEGIWWQDRSALKARISTWLISLDTRKDV
jgi:hypothetical protein